MLGKITLITPPDIFENENLSFLFVHLSDDDQIKVSEWFGKSQVTENINVYFYSQEPELEWLLYAANTAVHKVIDLDNLTESTRLLAGYFLGKNNFSYITKNDTTAQISKYINASRITNINDFLEKAFNDKNRNKTLL